jgi:hypothetical protein
MIRFTFGAFTYRLLLSETDNRHRMALFNTVPAVRVVRTYAYAALRNVMLMRHVPV